MSRQKVEILDAKDDILDFQEDTDEFLEELMTLYDQAAYRIEADIQAFFQKYADENGLSLSEAKRLLNAKEYRSWKKSIEVYLKEIADAGEDTKLLLDLNTLAAKSHITRQEQLLGNIYKEMAEIARQADIKMEHHLQDVLIDNYGKGLYKLQKAAGIGFNVSGINTKLVKKVLAYPWSTKTFSEDIWGRTDLLCETLRREITSGLQDGSSIQKIISRVDGCMGRGRYNATRIVRTECKYFANQGQLMAYQKMGVKQYRFVGGGCPLCKNLNGKPFDIEDAEVYVNYPPIHPNCKCTTVALFDLSLFDDKRQVTPLHENIKFKEWKQKYLKS